MEVMEVFAAMAGYEEAMVAVRMLQEAIWTVNLQMGLWNLRIS